jgi:hypothetical protein
MDSLALTLKEYLSSPNFKEIDWKYWRLVSKEPPPRVKRTLYFHIRNMEFPEIIEECIYFSIISQLCILTELEIEKPPFDYVVDEAINRVAKSDMYIQAYRDLENI